MVRMISGVFARAAAAVLAGLLALPLRAQTPPGAPDEPPPQFMPPGEPPGPQQPGPPGESLLPEDGIDSAANREQILKELYTRLSGTEDQDSAELVASAIEKLWLRSGSDTVDLLMERSGELMKDKDFATAQKILDTIVAIAPEYPEGWTRRAATHFAKEEFGESLQDLRHALALDPSHYKAIQGLGLLMQELGDKQAALKAYREVLKVHPHLDDVRRVEQELSREVEGQGI